MRNLLLAFLPALLFVSPLCAHPVPKTNRDRTIIVNVTATALIVDYRLEIDEASVPNELTTDEKAQVTSRSELLEAFTKSMAKTIGRWLDATLDNKTLHFKCVQQKYMAADHVRCDFRFESPWTLQSDAEYQLTFHESNFNADTISRLYLYLAADDTVQFISATAPTEELMRRSSDDLRSGDDNRRRRAAATFRLALSEALGMAKPGFPPDDVVWKASPDGVVSTVNAPMTRAELLSKTAPTEPVAFSKSRTGTTVPSPTESVLPVPSPEERPDASGKSTVVEPSSVWARIAHPSVLMDLLLDTREGLVMVLLIAALAGAAHALTPGHGKTLVAAYLVGERGTPWHAILLGIVTTLTHTGAVFVLAAIVSLIPGSENVVMALQGLVGGFLITGLGLWLLFRRLSGQADHFHIGGGHHHHHHSDEANGHHEHFSAPETGAKAEGTGFAHQHAHSVALADDVPTEIGAIAFPAPRKARIWEVITLGMVGGLMPCMDAVILLIFAFSSGHARLGLPLLLAFSAGLASVLVVLGLTVVAAKRVAQLAAPSSSKRLQSVVRLLPYVSAVFVILMGLWLCYRALHPST